MDYSKALEITKKYGQEHILAFWDELTKDEQTSLLEQIESIEFDKLQYLLSLTKNKESNIDSTKISPSNTKEKKDVYEFQKSVINLGEETLREGKIACLLVAGGQGSRLGFEGPKGCFQITPVANKSLFQVFAEQILATQNKYEVKLDWYIMTSLLNNEDTINFFKENNYFGLSKDQIFFFSQKMLPAIDKEGKLFLSSKNEIFKNPNGHGGVYEAMKDGGVLKRMQDKNIKYVSFVQVDNCAIDIFDLAYIGLMEENDSDFGMKSIKKVDPEEKVGLICDYDGVTQVLEYSNISSELTHELNEDGELLLNDVNLNTPIIKRTFIEKILTEDLLPLNIAFKQIPHIIESGNLVKPEEPNGYKFEKFVFDAMKFTDKITIIQTKRKEEFMPVKNATGENSPLTAKLLLNRKAKSWMEYAGFDKEIIEHIYFAEISPLFALDKKEFAKKVKNKIEFYENEMIEAENFYFE